MRVEYIPNRVRMSRASHRLIFDPPHPDPRLGRAQSNSRSEGIPTCFYEAKNDEVDVHLILIDTLGDQMQCVPRLCVA